MARETSFYPDDPVCTRPDEFDYDVIVVGSGIAGLSAAYNIMQKNCGITVLVLEGSDKIGGRLGISGATRGYFIDDRQTHINRLINELGLKAVCRRQVENERRVYYSRNGPISQTDNMFDEINGFVNGLDLTAASIDLKTYADYPQAKKLANTSLDALIQKFITNFEAQELMKAITYAICGVEAASVSALWFIVMAIGAGGLKRRIKFALGNNRRKFLADGTGQILEKLLDSIRAERSIKIETKSVVDLIEFNDVCTYVSVRDGEQYICEYVIVAVPPPENSKIRILPPNKEILRNQRSHESGRGTFFLAIYDEPWWLRENYSGEILSSRDNDCDFRLVYEATCPGIVSPALLAGFLKGCLKKSSHPLETLRKCWTRRTRRRGENSELGYSTRLRSYTEWDWPGEDEETGITEGGYPMNVMKPCHIKNHMNPMLLPHKRHGYHVAMNSANFESRVYWACSEYARYWPGTLDGAVESGEYVACSIIFHLRPQSLNSQELRFITPDTVAAVKNHLPLDLVALHFVITGIVTAILMVYCKPVEHT